MVLLLRGGLLGLLGVALGAQPGWSQAIMPDNTLGPESSRVVPSATNLTRSDIAGGAIRGANLFHSFSDFNVDAGRSIYFANPAGIESIIGRVTGGLQSNIQGNLGVLGTANLFLLNPNGFVFGPAASLDLRGSFVASTGGRFAFDNGAEFSAVTPGAAPLLTIGINPGLQVARAEPLGPIVSQANLTVVVGGLGLAGTRLELGGQVRSGGNVTLLGSQGVTVQAIDTRNPSGSGAVSITSGGDIGLNTYGLIRTNGQINGAAGDVSLVAAGRVSLGERSVIQSRAYGTGTGGDIRVSANALTLNNRSQLDASNFGSGIGGNIGVDVRNDVTLRGTNTRLVTVLESAGGGRSGSIQVRAGALTIGNGAGIFNGVRGQGTGGNIEVDVRGQVAIDGTGGGSNSAIMNALYTDSSGTSGDIVVRAGSLSLTDGGLLTTEAGNGASGTAGNINAVIQGSAFISGIPIDKSLPDIGDRVPSGSGKVDVFFLADNTSSMEPVISAIQDNADTVLSNISGGDPRFQSFDIGYGVGSYVGDPLAEFLSPRTAYRLRQSITDDDALAETAIKSWRADNGGDFVLNLTDPEGNFFALHQVATSGQSTNRGISTGFNTGWRDGAERVIVWFGDAPSFQTTVTQTETINALKDNNVRVIALNTSGIGAGIDLGGQASAIVNATGGALKSNISIAGVSDLILSTVSDVLVPDVLSIGTNKCNPNCVISSGLNVGGLGSFSGIGLNIGSIKLQSQTLLLEKQAGIISTLLGKGLNGDIEIISPVFEMKSLASITSLGVGLDVNLGGIFVNSSERLDLQGASNIANVSLGSGIGGKIGINTNQLNLEASQISTLTLGDFQSGDISIDAKNVVLNTFSGIISGAVGASQAGSIFLNSNNLSLTTSGINSSSIDSNALRDSNASLLDELNKYYGPDFATSYAPLVSLLQIFVDLSDAASRGNPQRDSAPIRLNVSQSTTLDDAVISSRALGAANGADISLKTGILTIEDSLITSSSVGIGSAGGIDFTVRDRIFSANSEIAATASQADGGNISLDAQDILLRDNSLLSTSVFSSQGGGGNITINARSFVATENSDILANAEDGTGGNISINSPAFLANLFSRGSATPVGRNPGSFDRFRTNARVDISADAASGQSGTVDIPNIDPSRGLVQLPLGLDDRRQIANPCSQGSSQQTRGLATRDEFVITGRGGIAKTPSDPRFIPDRDDWVRLTGPALNTASAPPTPARPPIAEATAFQYQANGKVALVEEQPLSPQPQHLCKDPYHLQLDATIAPPAITSAITKLHPVN